MASTPRGLRVAGRRLWDAVTTDFELDESAQAVLAQAAYTVDELEVLRVKLADIDPIVESGHGPRIHPAWVEARTRRLALAKIIQSLGLPKELAEDAG